MPRKGRFDIFLSFGAPDRRSVVALREALRREGLEVFVDERSIDHFRPITGAVEDALRSSRVLLAYYSRAYPSRPACQQELTAAFLAGQREGDATRRILVVNPEPSGTAHLLPAELADARFAPIPVPVRAPVAERDFRDIARRVRTRVDELDGTIGEADVVPVRRWYGREAGSAVFVGRYPEQWQLHTALRDADHPLTRPSTGARVATVVGMPGIGKTALVAAYAWNFGAYFAGGAVCWVSLDGAGPSDDEVLARYDDAVRTIAEQVGVHAGGGRYETAGRVAAHLDRLAGPSLWVVDDVPAGLDPDTVRALLLPGDTRLCTILTCHEDRHWDVGRTVPLGPMTDADVATLLGHYRPPEDSERTAFDRLVPELRGHPLLARLAGTALRNRRDLVWFDDLADNPDTAAVVTRRLEPVLRTVGDPARVVLRLARLAAPAALPARFLGTVVDRVLGPGLAAGALGDLEDLALASVEGARWRIHQLVLNAADMLDCPVAQAELLHTATAVLDMILADPDLDRADRDDLMRHAGSLASASEIEPADAVRLLRRAADHYDRRGEPVLSAPLRERLAGLDRTPAAFADAAEARLAAGEYEIALDWAGRATGSGDPLADYRGRRALAQALDALGRYEDAEPHWHQLDAPPSTADPMVVLRTDVARLRSLRLRGRMGEVKATAPEIVARAEALDSHSGGAFDLGRAAELDLARAEVLTDGQRRARLRAESVIDRYRERDLPEHARALEAQEVLAEARLTMHLWELNPDKDHWSRAEAELQALRDEYVDTYGRDNPLTLAAGVQYAYAVVSQGRRETGGAELDVLLPAVRRRLGPDHPLYYRALFLRGLIHAQLDQPAIARPLFEQALAGQKAALGLGHAHTLRTQYELAIALKLEDDPRWRPLMEEVRERARAAVGRENDLYAQAQIALALLRLPTPLVRALTRFGRPS